MTRSGHAVMRCHGNGAQDILQRAKDAAAEGVCHIELASEVPWPKIRSQNWTISCYGVYPQKSPGSPYDSGLMASGNSLVSLTYFLRVVC